MCNFRLIGDPSEMFYTLTSNFREFKEYLSQKGYDEEDLKLSTNVLDDCTDFIVKNYKENNELLKKTLQYIEDAIAIAYQDNAVMITIFEGLYSQYPDILESIKDKFGEKTKRNFEDWYNNYREKLFGNDES